MKFSESKGMFLDGDINPNDFYNDKLKQELSINFNTTLVI